MNYEEKGWKGFVEMCLACNEEALETMLSLFLSVEEKADIARRFLIVRELIIAEKTQRAIAKSLNVSIAKITRGSNELKRLDPKWLDYLKKTYQDKSI